MHTESLSESVVPLLGEDGVQHRHRNGGRHAASVRSRACRSTSTHAAPASTGSRSSSRPVEARSWRVPSAPRATSRSSSRSSPRPPSAGDEPRCLRRRRRRMLRRRLWLPPLSSPPPSSTAWRPLWSGCRDCRLAESRTTVVVGVGSPTAELMFVGRGARVPRGPAGRAVRGPGGGAARRAAGRDRARAGRRLHRERHEVPSAWEPRPARPTRSRPVEGKLVAPDRARAARGSSCTLGNFAHAAPVRPAARRHARARPGAAAGSAGTRSCSSRSTTRPRRSTTRACAPSSRPTSGRLPRAARAHLRGRRRAPSPSRTRCHAGHRLPATDVEQLGLF